MLVPLLIAAAVQIAEGVWAIRHPHAPDGFPQGNTTVVLGRREALVVDAPYLPSAARADAAEIRKLTKKPVRWLVNTHWHPDHTRANAVYASEFPGLSIVAQRETVELLQRYEPPNLARYPSFLARFKDQPAKLDDVRKSVDVREFRAQFASSAAEGEELDEAAANLIRLVFEQAPK